MRSRDGRDLKALVAQAQRLYARTRSVEAVLEFLRDGCSHMSTDMNAEEILSQYEEEIIKWVVKP